MAFAEILQLQELSNLLASALPAGFSAAAQFSLPHPNAVHEAPVINLTGARDPAMALAWLAWAGFMEIGRTAPFVGQDCLSGLLTDLVSIELVHAQLPGSAWLHLPAEISWSN
ncbi:hypothetical protein [Cupriavidus sp. SS-3]|uniref:hypothetical protein n=1 Tax=Cupriavidus sp. SS-3 TaxID=3109596 RepID=UPI002DB57AE3|nr:hypothetical protein [Cupriavidus sp. SS-3]MEC3764989.1 hypothetical protein [Cupriavidus sp. SS-3]